VSYKYIKKEIKNPITNKLEVVNFYGKLSCYGSYKLNVDLDDSDIDLVATVPDFIYEHN